VRVCKVNIQFLAPDTGYSWLLCSSWQQVLQVYCILLTSAEITSYTCTQKDLPELFLQWCVYGLCAYYVLPPNICNCSYNMQSTCYVHFMSYGDQRNRDLIFLNIITLQRRHAAYIEDVILSYLIKQLNYCITLFSTT
jgi:hypothetical protein